MYIVWMDIVLLMSECMGVWLYVWNGMECNGTERNLM